MPTTITQEGNDVYRVNLGSLAPEVQYRLVSTCGACPEAYNVFLQEDEAGEEEIAYMRLRHGHFAVVCQREVVYSASPKGDGVFDNTEERTRHIQAGLVAIAKHLHQADEEAEEDEDDE